MVMKENKQVTDQQHYGNETNETQKLGTKLEVCTRYRTDDNTVGFSSAEEFVRKILDESSKVPCDDALTDFNKDDLPNFYDPVKFKRAQQFFNDHVFALYFNKLFGLIITLAVPSVLKILQMTKMSGCVMTSFRRYVATLLHMNTWYQNDLTQDSRAMQSIRAVKSMHNSASKQARNKGMPPITQKDMVLTQFGFMGLAISRTEMIGIHNASNEDLESFIHFWRVIGNIMGIQDRFNLCRTSLEETREICEILLNKFLLPSYESKDEKFLEMTSYLVNGMWHMNPFFNYRVFLSYLYEVLKPKNSNNNTETRKEIDQKPYFNLSFYEKLYLQFIASAIYMLKFTIRYTALGIEIPWYLLNFLIQKHMHVDGEIKITHSRLIELSHQGTFQNTHLYFLCAQLIQILPTMFPNNVFIQ